MASVDVSPEGVALTQRKFAEALHERRVQLEQLERFKADYAKLDEQLRTLPMNLSYQVMVPFGDGVGFMPGKIKNTNQIYVLLGDDYFALRTAHQSRAILSRRQEFLDDKIEDIKKEFDNLKAKLGFTAAEFSNSGSVGDDDEEEEEEELFEIREEYFSDDENPERKDVMGTVTPFKAKVAESQGRVQKILNDMQKLGEPSSQASNSNISLNPADLTQLPTKSSLKKSKDEKSKKKETGRRVSFAGGDESSPQEEMKEHETTNYQKQPQTLSQEHSNQITEKEHFDSMKAFSGVIKERPSFDSAMAFSGVIKERTSQEDTAPSPPQPTSSKAEKKVSLFKQAAQRRY